MNRHLLDVNALIALLDPEQAFSPDATRWFYSDPKRQWLTCPITENGAARILALPKYPRPQPLHATLASLRSLTDFGRHEHVPDDVSLLNPDIDARRIHGSGQVTDTYLALLAHVHGAALATFDRRISTAAIGLPVEIFQIPTEADAI